MNWVNFLGIIGAFLIAVLVMPGLAVISSEDAGDIGQGEFLIQTMFMLFGFLISGMIQSNVFRGDETKKWGYFTASHPKGVKGQVYYKYLTVFLMILMGSALCYVFGGAFSHLAYAMYSVDMTDLTTVYMIMFFVQLILRAIELPFYFRFGSQRGGMVKMLIFLGAFIVVGIYLLFGPLPKNFDDGLYKVFDFVTGLQTGKSSDTLILGMGIFQLMAVIAYLVSYKISCRLFMKGVEQYDK
ncbi:MAG: ABC-2 transporter permease [Ruminococcus sp.]|nr:ABC-2 transporter permease [Ruminococcus sp.]